MPRCDVWLYDIAAGTRTRLTNQAGRHHYYPAVTGDGTVYFVRSRSGCGASVQLMRRSPAEATVLLASFPARREAAQTSAVENDDGSTTFVYDRYHCRTSAWDVLKVVDP
jgi:Tol biopolymer transport system component